VSHVTLQDLIGGGDLSIGTMLTNGLARRRGTLAVVQAGGIAIGEKVFRSPTAAARSIVSYSVNGWTFWRLADGRNLAALRDTQAR